MSATKEFSRSGGSPGRGEKPAYTVPANLTVALPEPPLRRCAGSVHKKTRMCVSVCTCRCGFSRPITGFTVTFEDYCLLRDESTRYASGAALNSRNRGFKKRGGTYASQLFFLQKSKSSDPDEVPVFCRHRLILCSTALREVPNIRDIIFLLYFREIKKIASHSALVNISDGTLYTNDLGTSPDSKLSGPKISTGLT